LGLIHIRLATWFPFTIQVRANGLSWLAQQMVKRSRVIRYRPSRS
jgi:hypothetical protein